MGVMPAPHNWRLREVEALGTHQMLSLRSLAFILASAIRRARILSCAALQCFPDIIGRKIATRMAAAMAQSPANSLDFSRRSRLRGKGPVWGHGLFPWLV